MLHCSSEDSKVPHHHTCGYPPLPMLMWTAVRRCVAEVLEHVAGHGAEVMVATHNQASIEATVALMGQLGIEPDQKGVCMGQLLGMADHLTFTLGRNGYRVRPSDELVNHWSGATHANAPQCPGMLHLL